jgi:hypothetical protein
MTGRRGGVVALAILLAGTAGVLAYRTLGPGRWTVGHLAASLQRGPAGVSGGGDAPRARTPAPDPGDPA